VNAHRFPAVVAAVRDGRVLADNAAGAQVPLETIERVRAFYEFENAQMGAVFPRTEKTVAMLDAARNGCAELLGVAPATIGLGLNATSLAMAFARNLAHIVRPGDRVVVTTADHAANIVPWSWLARFGAEIDIVGVDAYGDIDDSALAAALSREPILVSLPWASNATGTLFPMARYAKFAKDAGAIVVADGVQAAPHIRIEIPDDVDFAFFSAYKIFGPHLGFFYAAPEVAERFFRADVPDLPSPVLNWAMETGTQCYEGWAGWLGTLDYLRDIGNGDIRDAFDTIFEDEATLVRYTLTKFAERADRIALLGGPTNRTRLPVFAFNAIGRDADAIARALAEANIEARIGDYYSRRLMNVIAANFGGRAIRFSFAHYNTTEDVDRCFAVLDR
jgi:selenocysteine lyase/cysteine desulfurase